mgnify:CR=1 FL=1
MSISGWSAGSDDLQRLLFGALAHEPWRDYGKGDASLPVAGQFFADLFGGADQADLVDEAAGHQVQGFLDVPRLPGRPDILDLLGETGVDHEFAVAGEPAGVGRDGHPHQVTGGISVVAYGAREQAGHIHFRGVSSGVSGAEADVAGRLTGRPGLCIAPLGPGATNVTTGVGDAFLDRSPMIAITCNFARSQYGRRTQMAIDQME